MADLTTADVVLGLQFELGDRFQKPNGEVEIHFVATLNSVGDGTAGHLAPASAFGLTYIDWVSILAGDGGDIVYCACAAYNKSGFVIKAAATNALANYSDTVKGRLRGRR